MEETGTNRARISVPVLSGGEERGGEGGSVSLA